MGMPRYRRALVVGAALAAVSVGTTSCEIYDSNSNGVYDQAEINSALWRWWNCDVLGPVLGGLQDWSCHPHL